MCGILNWLVGLTRNVRHDAEIDSIIHLVNEKLEQDQHVSNIPEKLHELINKADNASDPEKYDMFLVTYQLIVDNTSLFKSPKYKTFRGMIKRKGIILLKEMRSSGVAKEDVEIFTSILLDVLEKI